MINYDYALLESECLRVINSVGLDYHFGFLHMSALLTVLLSQPYPCSHILRLPMIFVQMPYLQAISLLSIRQTTLMGTLIQLCQRCRIGYRF